MKIIILTFIIYAYACVSVLGSASAIKEYPAKPKHGFEDAIAEKCFKNSHDKNSLVNLEEAVNTYLRCQSQTVYRDQNPPHPVEQHNEFCRYFEESGFYSCMENLATAVLPCLDETEKFFPDMILKAYNTTFNKLCGTNGLSYTEYIFNKLQRNRQCVNNASRIIPNQDGCIRNLIAYKNFNQQIVDLNQHDYCIDMESFLNCATKIVEQQCDESFGIIKLISDLLLSVCKEQKRPNRFIRF